MNDVYRSEVPDYPKVARVGAQSNGRGGRDTDFQCCDGVAAPMQLQYQICQAERRILFRINGTLVSWDVPIFKDNDECENRGIGWTRHGDSNLVWLGDAYFLDLSNI